MGRGSDRATKRILSVSLVLIAGLLWAVTSCTCSFKTAAPTTDGGGRTAIPSTLGAAASDFPPELVAWTPWPGNPVFTAEGTGHWDVKIRERGWIISDPGEWRLWFTGYDGSPDGTRMLGYASSPDGIHWTASAENPVYDGHWVEDMAIVEQDGTYYMFAESDADNHTDMLTSKDGIHWVWAGSLDVRRTDGRRTARYPCGTPAVWVEDGTWYLMYEWWDRGVWLATTEDPLSLVWTDVQEEPVLLPGPEAYDKALLCVTQVIMYKGAYFALYSATDTLTRQVWSTNIARSIDRVHWQKYPGNPLVRGKSSAMVVQVGDGFRLYTMHTQVDLFESR